VKTIVVCFGRGTCVERREAFHLAFGVDDPTPYEDSDYWVEARRKHRARQLACGASHV
jgi:7-cyano-7-deazaguanine synthase